jgi:hypothetical protein
MLFNNNPEIKNIFMCTINDILKELFSDYWYEKNDYENGQMSGVYDFEQSGRSVVNKLNTNYTSFCSLVTDLNKYLKSVGIDPLSFIGTPEEQIDETNRMVRYLTELRFRIFKPESETFKSIMSVLDRTNRFGDDRELKAVINLKTIFNTPKVFKSGELGSSEDMFGGVDAYMETDDGRVTFQIKPYLDIIEDNGFITVIGSGNVKPYKTNYLVFHNDNLSTLVFHNNAKIIDGQYVFDISDKVN